jgi:hypothetical protein
MKIADVILLSLAIMIIGTSGGLVIGSKLEEERMKKKAIDAGCAKYICNEKTGQSFFIYVRNTN